MILVKRATKWVTDKCGFLLTEQWMHEKKKKKQGSEKLAALWELFFSFLICTAVNDLSSMTAAGERNDVVRKIEFLQNRVNNLFK